MSAAPAGPAPAPGPRVWPQASPTEHLTTLAQMYAGQPGDLDLVVPAEVVRVAAAELRRVAALERDLHATRAQLAAARRAHHAHGAATNGATS